MWPLMTSGDLNIDLKTDQGSFEMIFDELSNTYFPFVLRRQEAELDGGVYTPPPPRPTTEVSEHRPGAG